MTNGFELIRFADDASLARAAAGRWLDELTARPRETAPYCVALSGGRIARRFFSELAIRARSHPGVLAPVHFFWADERCVPPTDSESNFALALTQLFEPLEVALDRIHRVRGEEPPEFAAAEAEAELCRLAPLNGRGLPVLDLVFLGMGEDGHVASLFPGMPDTWAGGASVYGPVTATKPPPKRITLSFAAIVAARQVWVLASGPGKERALRESLSATGGTPLAHVLQQRARTTVFTDIPGSD